MRKKLLTLLLVSSMILSAVPFTAVAAAGETGGTPAVTVQTAEVTSVQVVDGTDGYTPVTAPTAGQKLTANITVTESDGSTKEIGSYPLNKDATYKWYYEGTDDVVLGTEPTYTVTNDIRNKILCVDVTVKGYTGTKTWKATSPVPTATINGVKVVDGVDG